MHTYRCDNKQQPPPANTTYLDTVYTITEDREDHSQCSPEENNPNCTLAEKVCIEGPETRNINGLDVYKPCWRWKTDYVCASTDLKTTCDELNANPLCAEVASKCVSTLPSGHCGLLEHQYKCAQEAPGTTTETDCGLQTFCVGGTCFDTGYPPDQDIFKVLTAMEAANEASMLDLFVGEAASCSKNAANSCCEAQPGGESATNRAVASTAVMTGLKIGVEYIDLYGSSYIYEALNSSGVNFLQMLAPKMEAHLAAQPNFSVWGASFDVGVNGITYAGFDPWSLGLSVAMLVVSELMSCDQDEQLLGMKRGQGLCAHVGSWCSRKALSACVEKKEGWCCFSSVLARVINEQGRAQIGKSWGDPQNPNCKGFTLAELERLRFDQMDLTEFYNSINIPGKDGHYAAERLQEKSTSYFSP